MQVVVCQHLGAGLVTRGVRQKGMTPTAAVPPYGAALGPGGPASTPHYTRF
jgi:hypothetical protein